MARRSIGIREVQSKMARCPKALLSFVLLGVLVLVLILPSSLIGASINTGDTREFRFDPAVLLEDYQAGERLVRTTVVGPNVEATVGADKLMSDPAMGMVDGRVQIADSKAVITRTPEGRVVLQWDYDAYKRSISIQEASLKEEYVLSDVGIVSGMRVDLVDGTNTITTTAVGNITVSVLLVDMQATTFGATMTDGTGTVVGSPITLVEGANVVNVTANGTFVLELEKGTAGTVTNGDNSSITLDGESYSEDFEVSHISDPDSSHLVWMKDLILWTESEGYKWVSFYFDSRVVPVGLTDEELVDYWEELRYLAREQFVTIVDGQKDYSAMVEYYLGFVGSELENYMIMGVYNTDPGALRQVIQRQEVQVGGRE